MAGDALLNAQVILEIADVRPGMRVADFGAGPTGHIVLPLARMLGDEGVVYAIDIHPGALSVMQGHRALRSAVNLHVVRGDIERFGGIPHIAAGSLDRIFIVNTLWSLRSRAQMIAEARRLLHPNGLMIVIDWEPHTRNSVAPSVALRVAPHAMSKLFVENGCKENAQCYVGRHHWARVYSH